MFSYAGKVAWINLSNKKISIEFTRNYISLLGGRAVGSYLVFREVTEKTHPLDPGNIITINTGPLTGTLAPSDGRVNISSKNVANNGISFANAGGYFGPEMKYAGFDHLIIQVKGEKPVYLFIHDNTIEILSAIHLWSKDTWETEALIKKELNDYKVRVAAIGQAGENLVTTACIMINHSRAAGWGGCGSVMGSKNLKAIVVRGKGYLNLFNPEKFMYCNSKIWQRLLN